MSPFENAPHQNNIEDKEAIDLKSKCKEMLVLPDDFPEVNVGSLDEIKSLAGKTKVGEGFMVPDDFDSNRLIELFNRANVLTGMGSTTKAEQDHYINETVVEVAKIVLSRVYLKLEQAKQPKVSN